jgi:uncharacterized membrane protein YfcA
MSVAFAVTVALAVAIGISLGLLGGGGSILAVPLLVYVAGLPATEAIAISLFMVGVTSGVGLVPHARAGRVRWRSGLLFGAAAMAGAYAGGRLAAFIPATVLLTGFAVMMFGTAAMMIRGRRGDAPDRPVPPERPAAQIAPYGAAVGLVAGLVGAGGGFLIVPALVLLGGLAMPTAIGTSLLVIALQSLAGFAGHLTSTTVHWGLTLAVTAAAITGGLLGARLVDRIRPDRLRRWFGWLVIAMATLVLGQQLHALLWATVAVAIVTAATLLAGRPATPPRQGRPATGHDRDAIPPGVPSSLAGTRGAIR